MGGGSSVARPVPASQVVKQIDRSNASDEQLAPAASSSAPAGPLAHAPWTSMLIDTVTVFFEVAIDGSRAGRIEVCGL
jgi:hypothetical protein